MKKSGEIVSSAPLTRAPYPPLARSPFPNGEGCDTRAPLSPKQSLPRVGKVASKASRIGLWRYEREGDRLKCAIIREHPSAAQKGSQPRLAALGSPFQRKGLAWTLPPSSGRRCPEGAEVGWGKRYEKERERSSQVRRLREHPIHRCAVPLPQWGSLRNEDAAIPASSKRIHAYVEKE